MRRNITTLILAASLGLVSTMTLAADKVTLQLKWVTQAQFAGYFVAKDKGFYKDEGLDVTIKPGGPDVAPPQVIAGGGADVELSGRAVAGLARFQCSECRHDVIAQLAEPGCGLRFLRLENLCHE